jgi:sugar lactone lactonase YvrE
VGVALCTPAAWGEEPGTVLAQFVVPCEQPRGLTWDGQHLWLAGADKLYKLDPKDGRVLATMDAPAGDARSIAHDGKQLWCADAEERTVYRCDAAKNKAQPAFEVPQPSAGGKSATLGGMTFDGKHLWLGTIDGWSSKMSCIDPADGTVTKSYFSKGYPRALACDGTHLFSASDNGGIRSGIIYQYRLSDGAFVSQMDTPGKQPVGLAWDGQHLYCADQETNQIYKLAVGAK